MFAVVGVVASLLLVGCSAARASHDAAVSDVVDQVTELNDRLPFTAVEDAFGAFVTGEDEMGTELDGLLTIERDEGSPMTPVEVGLPASSTIMTKYAVNASSRDSCVVSVIKPSGYWVEAAAGSCSSGAIAPDVLRYIDAG